MKPHKHAELSNKAKEMNRRVTTFFAEFGGDGHKQFGWYLGCLDDFQNASPKYGKATIEFGLLIIITSSTFTTRANHHESNLSALFGVGGSIA